MSDVYELKGPAGRIVVRRDEVEKKLQRGYEFASVEDEARFQDGESAAPESFDESFFDDDEE